MRQAFYRMPHDEALAMLAAAPAITLAGVAEDGRPILRTLNAVVLDGALCFHGGPVGEKVDLVGRPVVVQVEETVARIPSHFVDPERACPATTYFRSAQVAGVVERVTDMPGKARIMGALMAKLQPEGGHVPITPDSPMYKAALAGIMVCRIPLQAVSGKSKLGQNRKPEQLLGVVEQLWRRGEPGDVRAIGLVRAANPKLPTPAFLQGPEGARLVAQMTDAAGAVALLRDTYWNTAWTDDQLERALVASTAWVGAVDGTGKVVATARAMSDGAKHAWIYDVAVDPAWQGRGLGRAVMRLLLDHPAVRDAANVYLATKDAMAFYERLGFVRKASLPPKPYVSTEMVRRAS